MFGSRRKRATSNPHLNGSNASVSANATKAAAQAFLKNQASSASLSSAAAAAALRSRPTPPTSVADVQTKRTLRRAGSTSSMGSSVAGSSRGPPGSQLERRGSQGSMTERTFREPSPARSSPVPSARDAPPVPAIPKNMQQPQPPTIPQKSHRRATSLEAPAMRVSSPPPNQASGRGSSLGPNAGSPSARRAGARGPGLSSVQELTSVDRPASRGSVHSINFSLPTCLRPTSPAGERRLTSPAPQRQNLPKITSTNQNLVYDSNTRSFLPEVKILEIEQRLNDALHRPVKTKKKTVSGAGKHLSEGGMGARPRGTAIDEMEVAASSAPKPVQQAPAASAPARIVEKALPPVQTLQPSAPEPPVSTAPPRRRKKKVILSDSEDEQGSYNPGSSDTDSDVPQAFNNRSGTSLAKKPSIVREDREREEEEDDTPGRTKPVDRLTKLDTILSETRQKSPSPLPKSIAGRGHGRGQARASAAFAQERQNGRSASQPPLSPTESPIEGVGLFYKDSIRGSRVQSVSPVRTTHFATTPDSLLVKHQPPARSVSPRKSALKHSNSPRGPSPEQGQAGDQHGSEASGSVVGADELMVPKKKANRVSFDETNVVVGHAAGPVVTDSPVVQSPQTKRSWLSGFGRGKKKETSITDEDDEIMKPRPALPSFGSVRERKTSKEVEERPLVKPSETVEVKLTPASPPLVSSPNGEITEIHLGQSNDHILGAIIAQDSISRNAANISKSREPLPPEVTSVEGTGYHSDTESSVYSMEHTGSDIRVARADSVKRGPEDGHVDTYRALTNHDDTPVDNHVNGKTATAETDQEEVSTPKADELVPEIAILQATPTIQDTMSKGGWPDLPGSWESSTSDSTQDDAEVIEPRIAEPTPALVGVAEPSPVIHAPIPPQIPEVVLASTSVTPATVEEPDESDADTSIYSDAAEELTDTEGDGFMSLDAVVDSPVIKTNIPGLAISTPPDSPVTKLTKEKAYKKNQLLRRDSEPELDAGWDKVQAYWSTLSTDKKRQLEIEAQVDAEEESDSTIEAKPIAKPVAKPKKKKAAAQPEPVPASVQAPVQHQSSIQPDRSYMIQPGAKAGPNGHTSMRSSMRPEPVNATNDSHIRKSMRGAGAMRGSLRESTDGVKQKGSLQKKYRPMSYNEVKAEPIVNRHVRALSAASAVAAPAAAQRDLAPKPVLLRRGSGDSDSSFKRAKPSNNSDLPSLRRSMRSSTEQESSGRQSSPMRSSRFSLRSLSPTGSAFRRPFNNSTPPVSSTPHMRNSMRSGTRDAPTMRNKSLGFGGGKPAKPSKQKSRPSKSRFADSSDEDEDRPAFRSRFGESSDEDEPSPMPLPRTMRSGAPVLSRLNRGAQDEDSDDLLDSDDEKPGSSAFKFGKKGGQNGTAASTNQGGALASGSLRRSGSGRETISSPATIAPLRPNQSRRGSFMSILRRKKPDPASKVRKSDAESPARRDTPLERSKSDLQQIRAERPTSPKLQKRRTMSRENSSSWPLPLSPPKAAVGEDDRPFSADNAGAEKDGIGIANENGNDSRPDLGTRRFTATGLADVDISAVTDIPGRKKKKFGKLRRMLRLDD